MNKIFIVFMFSFSSIVCSAEDKELLPQSAQLMLTSSHQVNHYRFKQSGSEEAKEMRLNAVAVSSYSWGMQEGAYFRSVEIKKILNKYAQVWNQGITFNKFIIDGEILMPMVSEVNRIYVKVADRQTRTVNKSLRFVKSARTVSQAPT